MVLSEFTGAAQSLSGSLIVNPWNTEELANALHDAVTMSPEQREANYKKLERYVFKYTSAWWGQSFVNEMTRLSSDASHQPKAIGTVAGSVAAGAQAVKGAVEGIFNSEVAKAEAEKEAA
ncbi:Alpha like protein [Verticillium longisporum]|nr:Alpha like protein [Verticillium longisporum]